MNKKIIALLIIIIFLIIVSTSCYFLWRPDLVITNITLIDPVACRYEIEVRNAGFVPIDKAFIGYFISYPEPYKENYSFWGVVGHDSDTGASPAVTLKPGDKNRTIFYGRILNNLCLNKFNACIDCGTRIYYEKKVTINDVKEINERNNTYIYQSN